MNYSRSKHRVHWKRSETKDFHKRFYYSPTCELVLIIVPSCELVLIIVVQRMCTFPVPPLRRRVTLAEGSIRPIFLINFDSNLSSDSPSYSIPISVYCLPTSYCFSSILKYWHKKNLTTTIMTKRKKKHNNGKDISLLEV